MFELNGYWQRAEAAGNFEWLESNRPGFRSLARTVKMKRARCCRVSILAAENYLSIPTFIRLGRKITV